MRVALAGEKAITNALVIVVKFGEMSELNEHFSQIGYERSQNHDYKPRQRTKNGTFNQNRSVAL